MTRPASKRVKVWVSRDATTEGHVFFWSKKPVYDLGVGSWLLKDREDTLATQKILKSGELRLFELVPARERRKK